MGWGPTILPRRRLTLEPSPLNGHHYASRVKFSSVCYAKLVAISDEHPTKIEIDDADLAVLTFGSNFVNKGRRIRQFLAQEKRVA